jgi:hypothetical protein
MTIDPTRPAASAVKEPARARRRGHQEPRSTSVQQAGHPAVDASTAAAEDTSLATSRWCRSRDSRRRAMLGRPHCCCRSHQSRYSCLSTSPCPYPCLCRYCWGWCAGGVGSPKDTAVPTVVGVEAVAAAEGALLLRAQR